MHGSIAYFVRLTYSIYDKNKQKYEALLSTYASLFCVLNSEVVWKMISGKFSLATFSIHALSARKTVFLSLSV
jgi:hypothetical protein